MVDGRPLLIAASTHPGEEEMALDACAPLWREHPDLLLLVAPRRPERFDEVDQLLVHTGLSWERRSRLSGAVGRTTRVLLLDTLGELPNLLPAARGVFVGGTIVPVGGHNVLEPALFGKPAAFGPFTANVAAAADALLEHAAAIRVHSAAELRTAWEALLRRPQLAEEMGARGRAVVAARSAVAQRTFEVVRRCLGK
jgi:3-deoxy-D-manno-octulosonic-acid transferase